MSTHTIELTLSTDPDDGYVARHEQLVGAGDSPTEAVKELLAAMLDAMESGWTPVWEMRSKVAPTPRHSYPQRHL